MCCVTLLELTQGAKGNKSFLQNLCVRLLFQYTFSRGASLVQLFLNIDHTFFGWPSIALYFTCLYLRALLIPFILTRPPALFHQIGWVIKAQTRSFLWRCKSFYIYPMRMRCILLIIKGR